MSDKPIVVDGIRIKVTAEDFDDFELLELMDENKFPAVLKRLFGEQKYNEIKEHLRDPESGKISATAVTDWLTKVAEVVNSKN